MNAKVIMRTIQERIEEAGLDDVMQTDLSDDKETAMIMVDPEGFVNDEDEDNEFEFSSESDVAALIESLEKEGYQVEYIGDGNISRIYYVTLN